MMMVDSVVERAPQMVEQLLGHCKVVGTAGDIAGDTVDHMGMACQGSHTAVADIANPEAEQDNQHYPC